MIDHCVYGGAGQAGAGASGTASADQAPATLVVSLPQDATLTIDDEPTTSTSSTRVFYTPDLRVDKDYRYTLKAEVLRDGKRKKITKEVTVRGGRETRIELALPAAGTAAR